MDSLNVARSTSRAPGDPYAAMLFRANTLWHSVALNAASAPPAPF